MKKLFVFAFIFLLIFSGCENAENPNLIFSESSSSDEGAESGSSLHQPESSGYENPYTSCVPEWSVSSQSSDPSYIHSTDTSSDESAFENIYYIKGRTVENLPEYSDLPGAALGNESALKRWELAISDLSDVAEIRVNFIVIEERDLSFEETSTVIENLRSISPKLKPEMDNPATGGSYTVAAFDSDENQLWRVSLDGYWFVLSFGEENSRYVFDMEGSDIFAIGKICDYRSPLSHP